MRSFRQRRLIIAVVVAAIAAVLIYSIVIRRKQNTEAREALIAGSKAVELGNSMDDVAAAFGRSDLLQLRKKEDLGDGFQTWEVSTPLKFGAKNWVFIILVENDAVVGTGFRTADSVYERPTSAPIDRVSPAAKEMWESLTSLIADDNQNR